VRSDVLSRFQSCVPASGSRAQRREILPPRAQSDKATPYLPRSDYRGFGSQGDLHHPPPPHKTIGTRTICPLRRRPQRRVDLAGAPPRTCLTTMATSTTPTGSTSWMRTWPTVSSTRSNRIATTGRRKGDSVSSDVATLHRKIRVL